MLSGPVVAPNVGSSRPDYPEGNRVFMWEYKINIWPMQNRLTTSSWVGFSSLLIALYGNRESNNTTLGCTYTTNWTLYKSYKVTVITSSNMISSYSVDIHFNDHIQCCTSGNSNNWQWLVQSNNWQWLVQSNNWQWLVHCNNWQWLVQSNNWQWLVRCNNWQWLVHSNNWQWLVQSRRWITS